MASSHHSSSVRRSLKSILAGAVLLTFAAGMGGCDYLNLRNSFLNPAEVGRFDKEKPWGVSKPVTWPILDQLDVIDEPNDRWSTATDPTTADIVVEAKEYTVGEGDFIRISVFDLVTPGLEYFKEVQVNELGAVTITNLGNVQVNGLTPSQIEAKVGQLAVSLGYILPKGNGSPGPQVSVSLLQSRSRVFSILGNAGAPGSYNIIGTDFRLLDALSLARDVNGGTQPGMDYLYVIRGQKGAGVIPIAPRIETVPSGTMPATNPLDTLDNLNKPATQPATQPGAQGPAFVRPLVTADVAAASSLNVTPIQVAQADLEAALGGAPAATATSPSTTPPVAVPPAPVPTAATPPATGTAVTPATPSEDLLNQATTRPGYAFVDGKWVLVSPTAQNGMSKEETIAAATGLSIPRIIRIPINQLREGNPKYNIVIRPGDTIVIPNIEPGEFYMYGHVNRPGVYSITGRKVTLKQALAAAGGLDSVAIPRRCDLIRRIGANQEVTVQVDLQKIWDGEQPDIFLKANDLINVGTDALAPILAVTRNAYRASYGWGFVYDQNFSPDTNNNR